MGIIVPIWNIQRRILMSEKVQGFFDEYTKLSKEYIHQNNPAYLNNEGWIK